MADWHCYRRFELFDKDYRNYAVQAPTTREAYEQPALELSSGTLLLTFDRARARELCALLEAFLATGQLPETLSICPHGGPDPCPDCLEEEARAQDSAAMAPDQPDALPF